MADTVDPATRSRIMAAVRGKDTGIEIALRRALFALGWRYRLHGTGLPGRPDLVFARRRAVVFVHGCFWHGHDCALFRLPATRTAFWRDKLAGNHARDARNVAQLIGDGWRVMTVWECALRGRPPEAAEQVALRVDRWLRDRRGRVEIRG